jgi:hypothetical protein
MFGLTSGTKGFEVFRSDDGPYAGLSWGPEDIIAGVRSDDVPLIAASVGVRNHFVLVCTTTPLSTTPGDYILYRNGLLLATSASGAFGPSGVNTFNRIGYYESPTNGANAAMDDICLWSHRALSVSEALAVYTDSRTFHPRMLRRVGVPLVGAAAAASSIVPRTWPQYRARRVA